MRYLTLLLFIALVGCDSSPSVDPEDGLEPAFDITQMEGVYRTEMKTKPNLAGVDEVMFYEATVEVLEEKTREGRDSLFIRMDMVTIPPRDSSFIDRDGVERTWAVPRPTLVDATYYQSEEMIAGADRSTVQFGPQYQQYCWIPVSVWKRSGGILVMDCGTPSVGQLAQYLYRVEG